ncbi:right-handed parallel beta-helix repeat-containing protein [Desulfoplanes sp.]
MRTKKVITCIVIYCLLTGLAACELNDSNSNSDVPVKNLWVSTTGSDSQDGGRETPFETIARAQQEVRKIKADFDGDIEVSIMGGEYRLNNPLRFTAQDSGRNDFTITYRAADNATVSILGSKKLTGWQPHDVSKNIFYTDDTDDMDGSRLTSRQLYVDGMRMTRARTEEYPGGFMPHFGYDKDNPENSDSGGILFIPLQNMDGTPDQDWPDPNTWKNVEHIEAVSLPQWKMQRVPLKKITHFPDYNNTCTSPLENLAFYIHEIAIDISEHDYLHYDLSQCGLIELQEPAWQNANIYLDSNASKTSIWSFFRVAFFENAYQFLDEPGEWYLNESSGRLYHIPTNDTDITQATAELPIREQLLTVQGTADEPVRNLSFENLTFAYATWMGPSNATGYIADQSGCMVTGTDNGYNIIGHAQKVEETPGNIHLEYVDNITFRGNIFEHLGAVALHVGSGSSNCLIEDNLFEDISSSAIWLGGVQQEDYNPGPGQLTANNTIANNLIRYTGQEYYDSAAIYAGFTRNTSIDHNTIMHVPWSAMALGWGWGLLDPGINLGLAGATPGMWGEHQDFTPNSRNRITNNRTYATLEKLWDAGAVYTTGYQGTSEDDALLIEGNVFADKKPSGGGNTIYNDGMSRYVIARNNVMYNNPQGKAFFGDDIEQNDPFYIQYAIVSAMNTIDYGLDTGGCRTYGNITYEDNFWFYNTFFSICPFTYNGINFPTSLNYTNNLNITENVASAQKIADNAGVYARPASISQSRWTLPPRTITLDTTY